MKKTLLILFISTSAMASSFNGAYLGASLGATKRDIKYEVSPITTTAKKIMPTSYSNNYTKYGALFGLHGGYGKIFNNEFYIGGEIGIYYDRANDWKNHSVAVVHPLLRLPMKVKFKSNYKKEIILNLSTRFGKLINKDCMIYLRPGFEISKDKFSDKMTSIEMNNISVSENNSSSVSEWKFKLAPGIGIEHIFSKNWSGRIEYVCSFGLKNKISNKTDGDIYTVGSHISHNLRLGISYLF